MSWRNTATTLDPGLRRGDDNIASSSRRRPGSSVCTLNAIALVLSCTPGLAQDWTSLEKSQPQELFAEKCGMCHHATGMGTGILARRMSAELGLLENRSDLQPEFVSSAVRAGFGVMFPMSRAEVSDAQLQAIIEYLTREGGAGETR